MGKEGTTTNINGYGKEVTDVQVSNLTPNLMEYNLGYSNSYEPLQLLYLVRGTTCEIIVGDEEMYRNYRYWMLRALCKERNLNASGTRSILISKLEAWDRERAIKDWKEISDGNSTRPHKEA